jgi:1-acyl-sn-glycerol-3-phosphate acyltransferase
MFETIMEWKWSSAYVTLHILTVLIYKYVLLVPLIKSQSNPEIRKKYAPFLRKDLDDLTVISAFPFYITYWFRIFCGWVFLMWTATFTPLVLYGVKDISKEKGWRMTICRPFMWGCARFTLWLSGYMWIDCQKDTNIDYKEYLGPDWKAEWEGAPTYIANHTSFLDIMYMVTLVFPGFVARASVKTSPGVGALATLLGSVYINRVDGTK